ncbi:coronin-6 [Saitoella complicata NRRL Y-17804]|uniref:coronin-6 n=1 Tax=Saitoella complicata (strain BCRC 22490 / CBS 7301 / JCM 7358 / NBRC 10748 / NRRL Y-17804) TaxID=698492 RepID=UPI000867A6C3|nr:coronin-6 [Saitoella complicata NRRL Y-17804]ODQ53644.1 coronin-6 [Saitoella complicata NRRL Y-17804]
MSGRFVRASKYRHIYGNSTKRELCYDNVKVTKNAWDSNLIKVNPLYLSINWNASGGGAFAVVPLNERGKLPDQIPLFRGHSAPVLDTDFNPFNDQLVASASDDGKICLWTIPDNFSLFNEEQEDVTPISKLSGHSRKVGHVQFHPTADNVLSSTSGDYTVKLWDISTGQDKITLKHTDIIQSLSWNRQGTLMVTTSRDKKIRIWDPRSPDPVKVSNGHEGAKTSRAVWLGDMDRIATTGFSKRSDRQLALWDTNDMSKPIGGFQVLDTSSGVLMPFYDQDTMVLYLAGKGDGNIRYYELENDDFHFLHEYKSTDPQRGMAFMPKRALNIHENEVMRAYKSINDAVVEPISFIVPRRAESFQSDIYPPALSAEPAISADKWFAGENAEPNVMDMEALYTAGSEGNTPVNSVKETSMPGQKKEETFSAPKKTMSMPTPSFTSASTSEAISKAPSASISEKDTPPKAESPKEKTPSPAPSAVTSAVKSITEPVMSAVKAVTSTSASAISATSTDSGPSNNEDVVSLQKSLKDILATVQSLRDQIADQAKSLARVEEMHEKDIQEKDKRIVALEEALKKLTVDSSTSRGEADDVVAEKDAKIRALELELEAARSEE